MSLKYDDASWHYGGDFPPDLPNEAGATHMAMFVAWAVLNGFASELHVVEEPQDLARLQAREITPAKWFVAACDEKFTDEDLNDAGNAFARQYYGDERGMHGGEMSYLNDYSALFADFETLYHVPDSWETFDRLAPTVSGRLAEFPRTNV